MSGRIPKYGANFHRVDVGYSPEFASRMYVLNVAHEWGIRADHGSKQWRVFWRGQCVSGVPFATMSAAMTACIGAYRILSAES